MNNTKKIIIIGLTGVVCVVCMVGLFLLYDNQALGKVPSKAAPIWQFETHDFFMATTTTATSTTAQGGRLIGGAEKVTFFFQRGDTTGQSNTGTSTFTVQTTAKISPVEADWVTYNKLIDNVTNSNSGTLTRITNVVLTASSNVALAGTSYGAATTTKLYSMDLVNDGFQMVRCVVNEVTDGEHTCYAFIEY